MAENQGARNWLRTRGRANEAGATTAPALASGLGSSAQSGNWLAMRHNPTRPPEQPSVVEPLDATPQLLVVPPPSRVAMGVEVPKHDWDVGEPVYLEDAARDQGTYWIGGTGVGKTTHMEGLIVQDIKQGHGVCVLDPHGDLITNVLLQVPAERMDDVVLLNPLDVAWPFALNLFYCSDPTNQLLFERTVDQTMHVFKKLWGEGGTQGTSWGPQMEDLLRNATITLTRTPGATVVELPRLLEDAEFRSALVAGIDDDEVRRFWQGTYDQLRPHDQLQYRLSTLNKVRPFVSRRTIRNILGQSRPKRRISFRQFMDEGKVVLVPLTAALLGDDVATLLGSMLIGEILTAALSRQDTAESRRRPFHLFVDEVQAVASADLAALLAQGRKYKVRSHIAHQFRAQLDDQNRAAMLNLGNLVVFRVSGQDAAELALQFNNTPGPADTRLEMLTERAGGYEYPLKDLVGDQMYRRVPGPSRAYSDVVAARANTLANLPPYHAQTRIRHGERLAEFTLRTFGSPLAEGLPDDAVERIARIVCRTRALYARPRSEVEAEIQERGRWHPAPAQEETWEETTTWDEPVQHATPPRLPPAQRRPPTRLRRSEPVDDDVH